MSGPDGTSKKRLLPGFDVLSRDPGSQQFLASLSADVLKTGINEDHGAVAELVSVLLRHDRDAALDIGESEHVRNELSPEVRAIWITILFVMIRVGICRLGEPICRDGTRLYGKPLMSLGTVATEGKMALASHWSNAQR